MASVLRVRSVRCLALDWLLAAFRSAGAALNRRRRSASLRFGVGLPLPTLTLGRAGAPFVGWGLPGAPVVSGEPVVVALRRRNTWPAYRDEGHG
jgi:hypothetical protein